MCRCLQGRIIRSTPCPKALPATCTSMSTLQRRRCRRTSPSCLSSRSAFAMGQVRTDWCQGGSERVRLDIIWKNKRSNTNHVKSSPRLPKAQKSRDADWIFIPQKPSLFLLSCSHSLQTTWMGQRSTPPTPLCVCSWKGSAAWRRWRNAEKPAYWSDWSGSPWRSTTRYGEGECRRHRKPPLKPRVNVSLTSSLCP